MKNNFSKALFVFLLLTCVCQKTESASSALWQTNVNFDQLLQQNQFVVIKFWMPGCPPCKRLTPIFEAASSVDYQNNVLFLTINIHEYPAVAQKYGVRSVPQIFYIKQGNVVGKQSGGNTSSAMIQNQIHNLFGI